jgi:hypothetical protein
MELALDNNALQLTSGGFMRASRASFMRRLQLSAVFCGPTSSVNWHDGLAGRLPPSTAHEGGASEGAIQAACL